MLVPILVSAAMLVQDSSCFLLGWSKHVCVCFVANMNSDVAAPSTDCRRSLTCRLSASSTPTSSHASNVDVPIMLPCFATCIAKAPSLVTNQQTLIHLIQLGLAPLLEFSTYSKLHIRMYATHYCHFVLCFLCFGSDLSRTMSLPVSNPHALPTVEISASQSPAY